MRSRPITLTLLLGITLLLSGCEPKINFELLKEGEIKGLSSIEEVTGYRLTFNPKANGVILVKLGSGSVYEAEGLNASQMSSLLELLKSNGLQFDTTNKEFILKGGSYE